MNQGATDTAKGVTGYAYARIPYLGPASTQMLGEVRDVAPEHLRDIERYLSTEVKWRKSKGKPFEVREGLSFGLWLSPDSLDVFRHVPSADPESDPVFSTYKRAFADQVGGVASIVVREFRGSNPQSPALLIFARDWQVQTYLSRHAKKVYASLVREQRKGQAPPKEDEKAAIDDLIALPGRVLLREISPTEAIATLDIVLLTLEQFQPRSDRDRLMRFLETPAAQLRQGFAAIAQSALPSARKAELAAELARRVSEVVSVWTEPAVVTAGAQRSKHAALSGKELRSSGHVNAPEAANRIGVTEGRIRQMASAKVIKAEKSDEGEWWIHEAEVQRVASTERKRGPKPKKHSRT